MKYFDVELSGWTLKKTISLDGHFAFSFSYPDGTQYSKLSNILVTKKQGEYKKSAQ